MKHSSVHHKKIENILNTRIHSYHYCSGGSVGEAWRIVGDHKNYIVKYAKDGRFFQEKTMLEVLQEKLPVPSVQYCEASMIILDDIPHDQQYHDTTYRMLGQFLGKLHHTTHAYYGLSYHNKIGALHQDNDYSSDWVDFFCEKRVLRLVKDGYNKKIIPHSFVKKAEKLCHKMDRYLYDCRPPSLIHGDLWGGNILVYKQKIAAFIDPALYYADPEIEIAYLSLFDPIAACFYDEYEKFFPLSDNFFEERLFLYQLYPLLVHVLLFQGSYVAQVEKTLDRFT